MNCESSRLRTFLNWPTNAPVDFHRIARAGFYFMGQHLEVQCFSCGGRISEWQYGDKVMAKHRLLDPRCPFVLNPVDSGNVPITDTSNTVNENTSEETDLRILPANLNNKTKYRTEAERMDTFITWPIPSKVEGYRLAKAGFYYLQELDKVRCAYCEIDCYNWETGDDPIVEHRRHSPMCPFLSNLSVGCSSQNSDDVIVLRQNHFSFEPEYGLDANRMKDFGILNHRIPKHSKFMTEESRIFSFEKWPKRDVQDPKELAKAGFYYTGVEDKVRCYHCGGGLQKWKINDDPWVEHTKWFSDCDFIYLVKGEDFISDVKQKYLTKNDSNTDPKNSNGAFNNNSQSQTIDDNVLHMLMTSAPVLSALELGLDMSRIKQVLRERLENHRKGFNSEDELISAVLDAQFNEPVADLTEESWITDSLSNIRDNQQRMNSAEQTSTYDGLARNQSDQYTDDDPLSVISEFIMNTANQEQYGDIERNYGLESESPASDNNAIEKKDKPSYTILTSSNEKSTRDQNNDTHLLEEENRRLKEAKLCKICMDQDANIVFLPCGHLVSCSSCAANIPDCPVCRQMIKGTVRTFLA